MGRIGFLTLMFVIMPYTAFATDGLGLTAGERLSMGLMPVFEAPKEEARVQFSSQSGLTYRFIGDDEEGALQLFMNGQAERLTLDEDVTFNSQIGVQYKFRF